METQTLLLHQSCGQHGTFWHRGFLSVESTVPSSHVSGDLSCEEGYGWCSSTEGGEHGQVRTLTNKEVLRFWKLAPCDVEARVRRLKRAQTLVQDPSHHAQVLTAMFGKLPAKSSATLNSEGELTPEANPWALRWMEDLEALQPYDERCVIQRMGKDVRALFLDRELADDFVAIDVSVLRLQSLSTQVPPWDFREEVGHPNGSVARWCATVAVVALTISVRRSLSFLRLSRRMCCVTTDKWRRCPDL